MVLNIKLEIFLNESKKKKKPPMPKTKEPAKSLCWKSLKVELNILSNNQNNENCMYKGEKRFEKVI